MGGYPRGPPQPLCSMLCAYGWDVNARHSVRVDHWNWVDAWLAALCVKNSCLYMSSAALFPLCTFSSLVHFRLGTSLFGFLIQRNGHAHSKFEQDEALTI